MSRKALTKLEMLQRAIDELKEQEQQASESEKTWKSEVLDDAKRQLAEAQAGSDSSPKLKLLDRLLAQFEEGEAETSTGDASAKAAKVRKVLLEWQEGDTGVEE